MVTLTKELNIDVKQVLRNLGYGDYAEPSARIASLVEEYADNALPLIEPSYSYVIKKVEWVNGPISFIEDSIIFKSQVLARLLEKCDKVAILSLTTGSHLEEMTSQLSRNRLVLQASVLDAVGSAAVENLANSVQQQIGERAHSEGLTISRRFSPGYCDWHIGQQRMLFWALEGNTNGIHLTESCLMIPQKSISGIIGIGPGEVSLYNPCRTCKELDCIGRR